MAAGDYFTESQRQAWGYAEYGVNNKYTMTGALAEYRAGGGKIRTQSWLDIWHTLAEGKQDWDTVNLYKPTDTLPAYLYTPTPINYRDRYTVRAKGLIVDAAGNFMGETYRQLSFSNRMTKQEIETAMREEFQFGITSLYGRVSEFQDWSFFEKV